MQEPLLAISEAARLFGVTPATVARWANEGKLAVFYTAGGQRRIPLSEIDRILTASDEVRTAYTERTAQQTRAARKALARKRNMPPKKPYTDEDVDSFGDYDEEPKSPLLTAFNGYGVKLR